MIGVRLAGGDCVWMDRIEVTARAYADFVRRVTDLVPFTDVPCQSKTSLVPGCGVDASSPGDPDLPVTCVDWCDARAYCRAQGRSLCGQPGGAESWWFSACASGGAQYEYPYGPEYQPQSCNGRDNLGHGCAQSCSLAPPGAQPECKTPSGILDLSGNVSEWVDECSGYSNQNEACAVRGGNVSQDAVALQCKSSQTPPRSTRTPLLGFRCCWRAG
jgi:formylglycine-generating enzyme required for sulfatase activity